jgi:cell division protein FtsZ
VQQGQSELEVVDYEKLDRPAVMRKQQGNGGYDSSGNTNMDYLDIPAFLRKQAD